MAERALHETTSLCGVCKDGVAARVFANADDEVWMLKHCAEHGEQRVRLSTDAAWYEATRALGSTPTPPSRITKSIQHGCPFDCGPCESHTQRIRMPVVTISSACDLDCPMCYVHNKNEGAYHMERAEFARVLDHLVADSGGDLDLINLTGGEPTLHPHFLELIEMCHAAGIHRVSICSHGLGLAKNEELVRRLADVGARIALSFDTFDDDTDFALNGIRSVNAKLRCLELLDRHGVDTTLIVVMSRGYNDHEIGKIIRLGLETNCVRHLEVHTITFTGQGGTHFDHSARISMVEVLDRIEHTSEGLLTRADFVPSPVTHPLCYQIAYLLMDPDGGPAVPFLRLFDRETMRECLRDHLYLEPTPRLERAMQDAIDALWVRGDEERTLGMLNKLLRNVFPTGKPLSRSEALRRSERAAKAIYVHSHMDEETFDVERAQQCCDSNCYADGTTIPVCNYNVLYREKEARFMAEPRAWGERAGRRLPLAPRLP